MKIEYTGQLPKDIGKYFKSYKFIFEGELVENVTQKEQNKIMLDITSLIRYGE